MNILVNAYNIWKDTWKISKKAKTNWNVNILLVINILKWQISEILFPHFHHISLSIYLYMYPYISCIRKYIHIYIYIYTCTKFVYITIYITIKKVNIWEYLRPLTLPIQSNFFYSKNFVLTVALLWCKILRLYVLSYWTSTLEKLFFLVKSLQNWGYNNFSNRNASVTKL